MEPPGRPRRRAASNPCRGTPRLATASSSAGLSITTGSEPSPGLLLHPGKEVVLRQQLVGQEVVGGGFRILSRASRAFSFSPASREYPGEHHLPADVIGVMPEPFEADCLRLIQIARLAQRLGKWEESERRRVGLDAIAESPRSRLPARGRDPRSNPGHRPRVRGSSEKPPSRTRRRGPSCRCRKDRPPA